MSDDKPRRWNISKLSKGPREYREDLINGVDCTYLEVVEASAYDALEAELAALRAKIEDAPWIYRGIRSWSGARFDDDKYRAKLVNVEKLDVLVESSRLAETKSGE